MDKVQIRNFVLLAQTLNFSAVAKQEFISQPALTKQINRLEEELGVQLFSRSKHGVSLTYAGEIFYKHAVDILDSIQRAEHDMYFIQKGQTGSLEISTVVGLDDIVSQSVSGFLSRCPAVNVNIVTGTGSQQLLAINRQAADVFFSYTPLIELFPNVDTLPLPDDRFCIYTNTRDAAKLATRSMTYLDRMTHLIEYRSEGGPVFPSLIFSLREALGLTTGNISYYSSNSNIMIAIQAGMGFALLPSQMNFGLCPANVVKLPLDLPEAVIQRAMCWHSRSTNIAVKHFVDTVRDLFPA